MFTTASPMEVLESCRNDGLLTDGEIAQASAHAHYRQLMPAVDHVGLLVWLVRHGILSEETLRQRGAAFAGGMLDTLNKANPGGNIQVQTPADFALPLLERWRARPDFDVLMDHGLITQAECVAALQHCGDDDPELAHTPASTLGWMMINRFVSEAREAEIFAQEKTMPPERAALVTEARQMLEKVRKQVESSALGGALIVVFVLAVIVFGIAWMIVM